VELELAGQIGNHLRWSVGGNYTSAKITVPVSVLGVERGDRVPGVPDYSVSTNLDYVQPLSFGARGIANLNAQWVGTSQGVIFHGDPDFDRPAYVVVGGKVGVRWPRLDVSLFVTNLLNQDKIIQRPNIAAVEYGMRVRPRTVGLSASYQF